MWKVHKIVNEDSAIDGFEELGRLTLLSASRLKVGWVMGFRGKAIGTAPNLFQ